MCLQLGTIPDWPLLEAPVAENRHWEWRTAATAQYRSFGTGAAAPKSGHLFGLTANGSKRAKIGRLAANFSVPKADTRPPLTMAWAGALDTERHGTLHIDIKTDRSMLAR